MTNTFDILLKDNTISLEKRNISTSSIFFVFWAVFFLQLLHNNKKCLCLNFLKGSSDAVCSLFFFESKKQPIFFYQTKLGYVNCSLRLLSVLMSSKKKHTRVSFVFMFVFVFVFVFFSVSFSFFKQLHTQILCLHSNQLTLLTQQKEREREGNFCFCVNCSSPKKEAVRKKRQKNAVRLQLEEVSNVTHCKEVKTRVILFNNIPTLTHLASSLQYMCLPKKKHNKKRVSNCSWFCSSLICPAAAKTQWAKKTAQESKKTNDISMKQLKQQAPFCFFFTELKIEHSVLFFLAYFRHLHEQTQRPLFYLKNCSYTKRNTNTNANANANTNINTNTNTELQNCFGWFFCSARDTFFFGSSSANKKKRSSHLCFFSTYNSALAAVQKLQSKKQKINTPFLSLLFLSLLTAAGSNKKKTAAETHRICGNVLSNLNTSDNQLQKNNCFVFGKKKEQQPYKQMYILDFVSCLLSILNPVETQKLQKRKELQTANKRKEELLFLCCSSAVSSSAAVLQFKTYQLTTLKDSGLTAVTAARTKTVNAQAVLHTAKVCLHKERRQVLSIRYFSQFVSYFHKKAHVQVSSNCSLDSIACMRDLNISQKYCLQKLVNICMVHGKKSKACSIITNTLYKLAQLQLKLQLEEAATQTLSESVDVIAFVTTAIDNVKPILEVKKVRISGSTQLVPSIISKRRQDTLAIRWILEAATKRRSAKRNLTLDQCLFAEIVDAFNKVGTVRKKRDELHKLAEANRGFSHYRWW